MMMLALAWFSVNLTFHQLMNGLVSKLTAVTPSSRLDHELANKTSFVQFLIAMSFCYEHKAVIEVYHAVHMAWQIPGTPSMKG